MSDAYLTSKRKKKLNYIPAEFAAASPEPCLINQKDIYNKDFNRLIKEEEKNLHFMVTNFDYLNVHAMRLLADLAWKNCYKSEFEQIKRKAPIDVISFKQKYWRIRCAGYHGMKSRLIYMITHEDDSNRFIVSIIPNDVCPACGTMNARFKIKTDSTNIRCGGCMSLPGIKKGL